jgi:N-acetylmuramoyl-L-alanine amidase
MNYLTTILFVLFTVHICGAVELSGFAAFQTNVKLIAIDPGFGGRDDGPLGCKGKLHAKDLNLQIAKKVAAKIKNDLGIGTIFTRDSDKYISLEERAAIANTHNADLLISIHTNATENASVYGIETFCLNLVTGEEAVKKAARINATSQKNIADMDMILSELMMNARVSDSRKLADNIQRHLYNHLNEKYDRIRNRGVRQAPFYIFLAADIPTVMVQTGFITNSIECERLKSENYQSEISTGIVKGIKAFLGEIRITQHITPPDTRVLRPLVR